MTERGELSQQHETHRARPRWRVSRTALRWALAGLTGLLLGVGGYTFRYAEGLSYLSADPKACVNCHIMRAQYDGWQKSSHHTVAGCVDCHLPSDIVPKYLAKAESGFRHSKEFTAQTFKEPILVKPEGLRILQDNCIRCHEPIVATMSAGGTQGLAHVQCVHCHAGVGHGDRVGL
ncbi:MAG: cytochrome c nitrite reductase small subunit, partial [Polyangiaceae bacterium]|nr:cytochrome c nitrite reductase small subunit [Polyangiaceae bacterium]